LFVKQEISVMSTEYNIKLEQYRQRVTPAFRNFTKFFGEEVRRKRLAMNLKQDELSSLVQSLGVGGSQSYISRLESNHRSDPSIQLILTLSIILDISLDEVIKKSIEEQQDE